MRVERVVGKRIRSSSVDQKQNTLTAAVLRVAAHCARATSGDPVTGLGYVQSAESAVTRVAIDTSFLKLNTILVVGDWGG